MVGSILIVFGMWIFEICLIEFMSFVYVFGLQGGWLVRSWLCLGCGFWRFVSIEFMLFMCLVCREDGWFDLGCVWDVEQEFMLFMNTGIVGSVIVCWVGFERLLVMFITMFYVATALIWVLFRLYDWIIWLVVAWCCSNGDVFVDGIIIALLGCEFVWVGLGAVRVSLGVVVVVFASFFLMGFPHFILLSSISFCFPRLLGVIFFVCSVCSRSCASSGVAGFGLFLTCCLSFKFVWFLPSSCWGWLVWLCLWLVPFSLSLLVVLCSPVSVLRPVSSVVSSQMKSFLPAL